jgi:hypothetical protein
MMTTQEIRRTFEKYFESTANITIKNRLVSCTGDVHLMQSMPVFPLPVQFKSVGGNFSCNMNKLKSLAGAPQSVGGDFSCSNNRELESLAGAPQSVGGKFECNGNKLKSLAGAPQSVGGNFYCSRNKLKSLTGAPRVVGGDFWANDNKLKSLTGAPHLIDGKFLLTYADNLPLLPLLNISGVTEFVFWRDNEPTNQDLSVILNRWANTGTRGMVPCAMEMIKAGYRSNAKL